MGFADPSVQRFSWPKATPYTENDAREFLAFQEDARRHGEEFDFAVVEPGNPSLVLGAARSVGLILSRAAPRWATGWRRARGDEGWRPMPFD